jgi:cytochrome bd-type quinol oxidase subunit 2
MSANKHQDVFEFGQLPFYRPEQMKSDRAFPQMPAMDWRLELLKNSPKICGAAVLFFVLLFGGSLLIANSSSDLRAWRGRALENSSTALLGLAVTAGGAYLLRSKSDV